VLVTCVSSRTARAPASFAPRLYGPHERGGHAATPVGGGDDQLFDVGVHARQEVGRFVLVPLEHGVDETDYRAVRHCDEHGAVGVVDPRPVTSLDAGASGHVPERRLTVDDLLDDLDVQIGDRRDVAGLCASDGEIGHRATLTVVPAREVTRDDGTHLAQVTKTPDEGGVRLLVAASGTPTARMSPSGSLNQTVQGADLAGLLLRRRSRMS